MEDSDHKPEPAVILVFSGKRKSGKDYVTDKLQVSLGLCVYSVRMQNVTNQGHIQPPTVTKI